jgi:hypothetical protein
LNGTNVVPPQGTPLCELADYRKIHGHCNVPYKYSENTKLAVGATKGLNQGTKRKDISMTLSHIQELKT